MRIEIWSDVVCPWCYIGKRRLETALTGFEGRDEVEIRWRSFQLDPGAPQVPTESVAEHLGRKYGGGPTAGTAMIDRTEAVAAEEGLIYRLREAKRANTLDAHRLLHLALREGGVGPQGELKEALLSAYFTQARNTSDHDVLVDVDANILGLIVNNHAEVLPYYYDHKYYGYRDAPEKKLRLPGRGDSAPRGDRKSAGSDAVGAGSAPKRG